MKNLSGKVAVITGGASGIGKAMASRFASADMRLTLVDIEATPLEATAEELRSKGAEVQTEVVDVADADAMDGLREAVLSNYGAVHLVCNNAGVAASGPMWELTEADWTFTFGANLWGVIHGVRGPFRQHGVDGGARFGARHGRLQRHETRRRGALRNPLRRPPRRAIERRRFGTVSGVRANADLELGTQSPAASPQPVERNGQ